MAGMKVSLESAMRARDVSRPRAADEVAAERTEAAVAATKAGSGTRPAPSGQAPVATADVASVRADQPEAGGPERRAATGRSRDRRRRPSPRTP